MPAHAASLGRLQVLSAAGQPLLAEIDVEGLQPDEAASLKAGVADPAAFKAAQLEASPLLSRLQFQIVRGLTDDRATVRITSTEPLSARALDALIELSWASGKVVREYTLATARPAAEAPTVTPAESVSVPAEKANEKPIQSTVSVAKSGAAGQSADSALADKSKAPVATVANGVAGAKVAAAGGRVVQRGESLGQIAREVAPNPAAVNSAMAALFEKNRAAFIGNSIHLLREGAVLEVPAEEELTRRSNKAALQMLAEFDDRADPYFQRLAAAPAPNRQRRDDTDASSGQIGRVQVEKPAPKADDQLKVSRSRKDDKSAEATSNALAEENLIKEKALREANERIAALEKNLADMQRLLELKAAAGKAEPTADKAGDKAGEKSGDKATEKPQGLADAGNAANQSMADGVKPAEGADKPTASAEAELKPLTSADPDKPKTEAELADALDEDEAAKKKPWYQNGLVLAGAGGAIVLGGGVAGFLFYRRRKSAAEAPEDAAAGADALAAPPADLLNADAGQSADADFAAVAASDAPAGDDFVQAGDATATEGLGGEASELAKLDADALSDAARDIEAPELDTAALADGDTSGSGLLADSADEAAELAAASVDLDFAGAGDTEAPAEPLIPPEMSEGDPPRPAAAAGSFADELDALSAQVGEASASIAALSQAAAESGAADDDLGALGGADSDATFAADDAAGQPGKRLSETLAAIDLDLPAAGDPLPADPLADVADAPSVDDDFAAAVAAAEQSDASAQAEAPTDKADLARWQEMETKLDLAAAYIEIGDAESARDLLSEVLKKGDSAQNSRAAELMARAA